MRTSRIANLTLMSCLLACVPACSDTPQLPAVSKPAPARPSGPILAAADIDDVFGAATRKATWEEAVHPALIRLRQMGIRIPTQTLTSEQVCNLISWSTASPAIAASQERHPWKLAPKELGIASMGEGATAYEGYYTVLFNLVAVLGKTGTDCPSATSQERRQIARLMLEVGLHGRQILDGGAESVFGNMLEEIAILGAAKVLRKDQKDPESTQSLARLVAVWSKSRPATEIDPK